MKMKRILVALMALAMIVTGMTGTNTRVQAATGGSVIVTDEPDTVVNPGETKHIKIGIKGVSTYIYRPTIELSTPDNSPITASKPVLTANGAEINYVSEANGLYLEFDVTAKETAKINTYTINAKFTYDDFSNNIEDATASISTKVRVAEEKSAAQLTIGSVTLDNTNLGNDANLSFTVKNEGEISVKNAFVNMSFGDFIQEGYTAKDIKVGDLAAGDSKKITLPVSILSTTTAGRKTIAANFTYKNSDGAEIKSVYNFSVTLNADSTKIKSPKITITNMKFPSGLKQKDKFSLNVELGNGGEAKAKNIQISIDDTSIDSAGILKEYFTNYISVDNMDADSTTTVKIPLSVSKYATGGLKAVKVAITYTDDANKSYTLSDTAYIDIAASVTPTPTVGSANIVISNVVQTPEQPVAGDKVEVSFDVENKGTVDAKDLKISTEGLTSATFIPVKSEPYQYFDVLKAGETIRVTIPLVVSTTIVEGLNNITVKAAYIGNEAGSTAVIPIRNVKNEGGISKPKLIVSKYYTDAEELRAGSTFNFTFEVYNTNSSVAAKNITITVAQADNIFTVTQGSNSFFVNKIAPGETFTQTVEMKVKSDATTKAYPIELTIEYEYDGAEPNPTTGEVGEKRTEKLSLQAVENARPVVNNVSVYSYDGNVMVGTPATLTFEFYNMGKSPLNNVIVHLEGDFAKTDGDMYFIGNAAEGSSTLVEFEVIPNIEGTANGLLRLTYEDSNGDEIEFTKDFSQEVMSAMVIDPGTVDPGSGEVFNPDVVTAKKEIVPVWAFVIIEVIIFILFIPITRKVIIGVYKSKLRKKEQEQY